MKRNRLQELQAMSGQAPADDVEMTPLKTAKATTAAAAAGHDDFQSFLSTMEEVVADVDKVEKNTLELRSLQRKILTATHKDKDSEERMEHLMADNKRLATGVRKVIQKEQAWLDKQQQERSQQQEWRMRRTQINSQSKRFYDIWTEYNGNQVEYRDKSKKLLVKRCKITNNSFSDEQIETMLDEGNTAVFATSILDEQRLARQQLTELQDRHDEFLKLEKSIREVHDMFQEVAVLVAQQGELVDNIEANVGAAVIDVEQGKSHLKQAEQSAHSARKKKFCLVGVLVVVILIVLLVILSELGLFSGSSSTNTKEVVIVYQDATTTSTPGTTTTTAPT